MEFARTFMEGFESVLHFVAEITVYTLELVGIVIIIIGSFKAIVQFFSKLKDKKKTNIIVDLGKALALALEFKMGAEIVKTVIVRDSCGAGHSRHRYCSSSNSGAAHPLGDKERKESGAGRGGSKKSRRRIKK